LLSYVAEYFVLQLLFKYLKFKIYKTITLPVVLYGCETWSLTLREERRPRVFENRVLRRIFGLKRDEATEKLRKLHNEELTIICLMKQEKNEMGWACSMYGGGGVHTGFWWGHLRERDSLEDPGIDGRIRWIFRKWDVGLWTGSSWLRTGSWRAPVDAVMNLWFT
jgi:hypothetical protein